MKKGIAIVFLCFLRMQAMDRQYEGQEITHKVQGQAVPLAAQSPLVDQSQQGGKVHLTPEQLSSIKEALQHVLSEQLIVTNEYLGIMEAFKAAAEDAEIRNDGQRLMDDLKRYVQKVFEKLLTSPLNESQRAKIYDFLQIMKEMVDLESRVSTLPNIDNETLEKAAVLKKRFLTHLMPVLAVKEQIFGTSSVISKQYIVQMLTGMIDNALQFMRSKYQGKPLDTAKPSLGEPVIIEGGEKEKETEEE